MTGRPTKPRTLLAITCGALALAAGASAQEQGSATTRSLNTAPPQTTLTPRPNAQPPLASAPRAPSPKPQSSRAEDRSLEDLLGETSDDGADAAETEATSGVTLAAGETEPPPIPITLGYYVRGDKDCDQVWPGDGDLAWMTPTAFTIDYGGCEPGQFLQTGPNSWREEQRCVTESGGNAGAYTVSYEAISADVIRRSARLAIDGSVERDDWRACPLDSVPENARFGS